MHVPIPPQEKLAVEEIIVQRGLLSLLSVQQVRTVHLLVQNWIVNLGVTAQLDLWQSMIVRLGPTVARRRLLRAVHWGSIAPLGQ